MGEHHLCSDNVQEADCGVAVSMSHIKWCQGDNQEQWILTL